MVATVPRHEARLAFSRRQHPGAWAGAGEPRQPSRGGARCAVLGRLWGPPWAGGEPQLSRPSVFPVVRIMLSVPSSPCISFSSGLCMRHTHRGEEALQALVRFSLGNVVGSGQDSPPN